MRVLWSVVAALVAAVTIAVAQGRPAAQSGAIAVGPNVQVSASHAAIMHSEGVIAADPRDARRLLACSLTRREDTTNGVVAYVSHDGGDRWQRTFESTPDDAGIDPACAFGPDGTAYLMFIRLNPPRQALTRVPLFRSGDGGLTWEAGGVTGYIDRESLAIDHTGGRYHNRLYAHGVAETQSTGGLRQDAFRLHVDGWRTHVRPRDRTACARTPVNPRHRQ
jgi:hypothetical protein